MFELKTRKEKDVETFIKRLVGLEPLGFMGVAKILGVRTTRDPKELGIDLNNYTTMTQEEKEEIKDKLLVPAEEILDAMIDKFAALRKSKRKEILGLLKDALRGK